MNRKLLYLFDLDGTITVQEGAEFETAYTKMLFNYASLNHMELGKFQVAITEGLSALSRERDGVINNYDCFMKNFTVSMGSGTIEDHSNFFQSFYNSAYDSLRAVVTPRSEMLETIEDLKREDHTIVLATNPLLPEIAINKKLQWLGIKPDFFHFKTVMENSYHVKPQKAYFSDILKMTGFSPADALMIGNDEKMDGNSVAAGITFINVRDLNNLQF